MAAKLPNLELTTSEKKGLIQYRKWITTYGAAPSVQQLATALGVTKHAAHYLIRKLEAKGYLRPHAATGRFAISQKGKAV